VEILIVRALAQWTRGTHAEALATLERALALAAPAGSIRSFVDEGLTMMAMLRASVVRGSVAEYLARLLAAFPGAEGMEREVKATASPSARSPQPALLEEPLSARELEVLRLIASGKSNAEVARALVIAVSTVKTHTNSIFGKLQVTSRTQAIALARDLQLL
jgi:LuxR family transcriptional regulator, maltose regulon positive regulatory protein